MTQNRVKGSECVNFSYSDPFTFSNLSPLPKTVFVTNGEYSSNYGGVEGADAGCNAEAAAAKLSGTYKAWLSDSTSSPSTRFTRSGEGYRLVNGIVIANDWDDLTDGTLAAPINIMAGGVIDPIPRTTATDADGTGINTSPGTFCIDWTSAAGYRIKGIYVV